VLETYGLEDGKRSGEVRLSIDSGAATDLEISPSGSKAAILVQGTRGSSGTKSKILVVDLSTNTVSQDIDPEIQGGSIAFAGESTILAASSGTSIDPADSSLAYFDAESGKLLKRISLPAWAVRAPVGTSTDGRWALAYTGVESLKDNALEIKRATFTIWDRESGTVIHSPPLPVDRVTVRPLDISPFAPQYSVRPTMLLSGSGNSVVVWHPGFGTNIQVFTRR
jgi:hypothetical protein